MSWQAFSWNELRLQSLETRLAERLQPAIVWTSEASQAFAAIIAVFLTPLALMEAALGAWRLCADLGWTGDFFIGGGLLSHWQIWFVLAALTQAASVNLNRQLKRRAESVEQR